MNRTNWKTIELAECVEYMTWPNASEVYRAIVRDVSRLFFGSTRTWQRRILAQPRPGLSKTNWDAMLAAVIEHLCIVEEHGIPEWTQEDERFLPDHWAPLAEFAYLEEDTWCPAAFLRHGAIPDPKDFDSRCGYRVGWEPGTSQPSDESS